MWLLQSYLFSNLTICFSCSCIMRSLSSSEMATWLSINFLLTNTKEQYKYKYYGNQTLSYSLSVGYWVTVCAMTCTVVDKPNSFIQTYTGSSYSTRIYIHVLPCNDLLAFYYPTEVSSMTYCCLGVFRKEYFRLNTKQCK